MRAIQVTLLLDVDTDDEAHDAMNEILREQQRTFAPSSCLIDYAISGDVVDAGPLPSDYVEGDYFGAHVPSIDKTVAEAECSSARLAELSPEPGSAWATMKSLSQIAAERAPLDQPAEIAKRLSLKQREILLKLATRPNGCFTAKELDSAGATLHSLADFERGKRDILPPLMLAHYEVGEPCRTWSISALGKQVLKHLPAQLKSAA